MTEFVRFNWKKINYINYTFLEIIKNKFYFYVVHYSDFGRL